MKRRLVAGFLGLGLLVLSGGVAQAQKVKPIETFTAFAANLGTGRTGQVTIQITRWSTDQERDTLRTTLIEMGPDNLLNALRAVRPPVGILRGASQNAWDLYYARDNEAPEGGRHVVLATDRAIAFGEAARNTRSLKYDFTLVELHLDKDGKGEGKIVPAAKVTWNADLKKIEIENYQAMPVDLKGVRAKKAK